MQLSELQEKIDEAIGEFLEDCVEMNCAELAKHSSLDVRALPRRAWLCEDGIILSTNERPALDYYGGFEYVDDEFVTVFGDYVMYSSEDDRVANSFRFEDLLDDNSNDE